MRQKRCVAYQGLPTDWRFNADIALESRQVLSSLSVSSRTANAVSSAARPMSRVDA
jgi:hypothetical protein